MIKGLYRHQATSPTIHDLKTLQQVFAHVLYTAIMKFMVQRRGKLAGRAFMWRARSSDTVIYVDGHSRFLEEATSSPVKRKSSGLEKLVRSWYKVRFTSPPLRE